MSEAVVDPPPDGWICDEFNGGNQSFPCNANAIEAVSLAIAAGGVGLLMTMWLTKKVSQFFF